MKQKKKPTSKPAKGIQTQADLAARLGVDPARVTRWMQRSDWPFGGPPWPSSIVDEVREWRAEHLGAAGDPELRREKLRQEIRKNRAQAEQAESALARDRGNLHDARECAAEAERRAGLYRKGVAGLPDRIITLASAHGVPAAAQATLRAGVVELIEAALRLATGEKGATP